MNIYSFSFLYFQDLIKTVLYGSMQNIIVRYPLTILRTLRHIFFISHNRFNLSELPCLACFSQDY